MSQPKPKRLKKSALGDHRLAVGVVADAASVLALDAGGVPDVVDVAVGEEERGHA